MGFKVMIGTFVKIVKFKDKTGKLHAYVATFINGIMVPEDWETIQKIINGIKGSRFWGPFFMPDLFGKE